MSLEIGFIIHLIVDGQIIDLFFFFFFWCLWICRVSDTEDTEKEQEIVTEKDLIEHLLHLLEAENANMEWQSMMDKSTPNMSYQAWRHEPQVIY